MNSIDDKTLVLLMSKVTNFDRDKTLKLSKKLSVDYEKAEQIVNVLQNVILTGHLNDLDSIDVNENQKRIIEKLLKKPTKPEKISKRETHKIQNGFVTHGCTGTKTIYETFIQICVLVTNSDGDLNDKKNVAFKVYFQKLNNNEIIEFKLNETTLKEMFHSLNEIQALRDNAH